MEEDLNLALEASDSVIPPPALDKNGVWCTCTSGEQDRIGLIVHYLGMSLSLINVSAQSPLRNLSSFHF